MTDPIRFNLHFDHRAAQAKIRDLLNEHKRTAMWPDEEGPRRPTLSPEDMVE